MEIKIIKESINRKELVDMAKTQFGSFVKAVVDINQKIMAVGGEMHADEETVLMEKENSKREDVWGINIYPEKDGQELIEFDSMVNIKPFCNNRSRNIENSETREEIRVIVNKLITK